MILVGMVLVSHVVPLATAVPAYYEFFCFIGGGLSIWAFGGVIGEVPFVILAHVLFQVLLGSNEKVGNGREDGPAASSPDLSPP